jgi:DNA polymerase III delta prime subunit
MSPEHPFSGIASLAQMASGRGGQALIVCGSGSTHYAGMERPAANTLLEAVLTFVWGGYKEILLFAGRGSHLPNVKIGPLVHLGLSRAGIYIRGPVEATGAANAADPPPRRFTFDAGAREQQRKAENRSRVYMDAASMGWKTRVPMMLDKIEELSGVNHLGNAVPKNEPNSLRRLILIDAEFLIPDRAKWLSEVDVDHAEAGFLPARFARLPAIAASTQNDIVLLARDRTDAMAVKAGDLIPQRLEGEADQFHHLRSFEWREASIVAVPSAYWREALTDYYPEPDPIPYRHFRHKPAVNPKTFRRMPLESLTADEIFRRLRTEVIGQDETMRIIAETVARKVALRADADSKPIARFLLAGPTGTGKTQTAKALARALYSTDDHLEIIDMGQTPAHASPVAELFGLEKGYVGFDESMKRDGSGRLTKPLIKDPDRQLIFLLDEMEKANEKAAEALFAALDEGRARDISSGKTVSFRNAIFILTTNAAGAPLAELADSGLPLKEILKQTPALLNRYGPAAWTPPFLARFDALLPLCYPDSEALLEIAGKMVRSRFEARNHTVEAHPDFLRMVCDTYDRTLGMRSLDRAISTYLDAPLVEISRGGRKGLLIGIGPDGKVAELPAT